MVTKNCKQCGKEFKTERMNRVFTCSKKCFSESKKGVITPAMKEYHEKLKGKVPKSLEGHLFEKGHVPTNVYKGRCEGEKNPNYKGGPVSVNCKNCGVEIIKSRGLFNHNINKRFFCGDSCYNHWRSINLRGKNAYSYKDPKDRKSSENRILRALTSNKEWKRACLFRDNFICQICGSNKKLQIHHIKSFMRFPEFRHELSNGITLCKMCHLEFHKVYSLTKFTSDDFEEFKQYKEKSNYGL